MKLSGKFMIFTHPFSKSEPSAPSSSSSRPDLSLGLRRVLCSPPDQQRCPQHLANTQVALLCRTPRASKQLRTQLSTLQAIQEVGSLSVCSSCDI